MNHCNRVKGAVCVLFQVKIHDLLDYLMGIASVFAPFCFWTTEMGVDFWVPFLLGTSMIIYGVWTDYNGAPFELSPCVRI